MKFNFKVLLKISKIFVCELECVFTKYKYYPLQFVPASFFYILNTNKKLKMVTMKDIMEVTCVLSLYHYNHCATILYFESTT